MLSLTLVECRLKQKSMAVVASRIIHWRTSLTSGTALDI